MAWRTACPGCSQGDHSKHVRDWNIRPGLIGGAWCDCDGEPGCSERFAAFTKRLLVQLGWEPSEAQPGPFLVAAPDTFIGKAEQQDGER